MTMRIARIALATCFAAFVGVGPPTVPATAQTPNVDAAVGREFIARHCASCHGETKPKGGIRLDALRGEWPAERESWENVRRVLLEKEMPPRKQTQPADPEVQAVIKWIEGRLNEATARTPPRRFPQRPTDL